MNYIRKYYLQISILILSYVLVCAWFSHRPLFSEGSFWYYSVLNWKWVFTDYRLFRYFDGVLQAPALIALGVFDEFHWPYANQVATYLLSFSWTMHPLISLFFSYRILSKYNQKNLILFPLWGTMFAYIPAAPYAVALALPALSLFWPLFFRLVFYNGKFKTHFLEVFLLSLALAFCYEVNVIFFAFFIVFSFVRILLKINRIFNSFVFVISLISFSWLVRNIILTPKVHGDAFINSFFTSIDSFRLFGFIFIFGLSIILFFETLELKFKKITFMTTISILFAACIWFAVKLLGFYNVGILTSDLSTHLAYNARTTALPLTLILAVICFLYFKINLKNREIPFAIKVATVFAMLLVAAADLKMTNSFSRELSNLTEIVNSRIGCVNLDENEYAAKFSSSAVVHYALPFTSIMLQVLNGVDPIQTLVFTNSNFGDIKNPRDACKDHDEFSIKNNQGFDVLLQAGRLKFSEQIIKK